MTMCCINCNAVDVTLQRCSRCQQSTYCSRECQREDWPEHKSICEVLAIHAAAKKSKNPGAKARRAFQQMELLGHSQITIANPRADRNITKHGGDTSPAMFRSPAVNQLLKHMGLTDEDDNQVWLMRTSSKYAGGTFARCAYNVELILQRDGGRAVYGWTLWQGKFCVEAEAHVVLQRLNDEKAVYNVTPYTDGTTLSGLFVEDDTLYEKLMRGEKGMPNNVLLWHR